MSIYDKSSLVLIPSGTKTGKVFSQKPVSGDGDFTFTRSSAATRVNADGNIEKETENQILYSQDFSDASWSKGSHTIVSNVAVAPDGTTTADKLVADNGLDPSIANSSGVFQNSTIPTSLYTISVYAKAAEFTSIRFRENYVVGSLLTIDLTNGSITGGGSQYSDAKAVSVGNGWYRISFFYNQTTGNPAKYTLRCADVGDGTSGVYIWGYQQEQGLVARDYIETTTSAVYGGITDNVPRLDYTDSSCPALLLEPLRTNLVPHSEYFVAWNKSTGAITITSNYGVSPEGLQNSSRVQFTSASQHINISTSLGTGVTSTGSVYIKGTAGETIQFDTGGAGALKTLTGDWQRIEVTSTSVSSLLLINTFGGATARDIEVWGAQCEQASYATSYIPTYGSSVSRVSETCEVTNVSSLIGQEQGTMYWDVNFIDNGGYPAIFLYDGTSNNRLLVQRRGNNNVMQTQVRSLNSLQADYLTSTAITNGNHKMAIAYATNDFQSYLDGSSAGSDLSGVTYTNQLSQISLKPNEASIRINQVLIFKTRLSNEELAALTTI